MFQLSETFIDRPILSLRTGSQVGTTISPIINPDNLKIEGFYCEDLFDKRRKDQPVLLYSDIRDIIPQGIVVDDHEALTDATELVRLQKIIDIAFDLHGKHVVTTDKESVGKVSDYAVELETLYVQKLYVSQSLLKSLTGGSLSIDRSNIVEVTDRKIVIKPLLNTAKVHQAPLAV